MAKTLVLKAQRDQMLGDFANQWQIDNANIMRTEGEFKANAMFNQALLNLQRTHPLFTDAPAQLRAEYENLLDRKKSNVGRQLIDQGLTTGGRKQ